MTPWAPRIRRLREALGLTQQGMAEQLGVTVATVNQWERGRHTPSPLARTMLKALEKRTYAPKLEGRLE